MEDFFINLELQYQLQKKKNMFMLGDKFVFILFLINLLKYFQI